MLDRVWIHVFYSSYQGFFILGSLYIAMFLLLYFSNLRNALDRRYSLFSNNNIHPTRPRLLRQHHPFPR